MNARLICALWLSTWALVCAGCNNTDRIVVPNRVLDRPMDVALSCVKLGADGRVQALSLNQCAASSPGSCGLEDTPQLIGFVANSEKNEVALWRRCDTRSGIVDLDVEASGYQLLPVGAIPSAIVTTGLGCRAVTANFGSCDLSVIDARQMGAYALGVPPEVAPSAIVSDLLPRTSSGEPIAARPLALLAVPERLSLSAPLEGAGSGDTDSGADDGGAGDDGGIDDPGDALTDGAGDPGAEPGDGSPIGGVSLCPADKPESVYVAFPACQLVAEVSVNSQRVLQSRRFVTMGDGTVVVEDAGSDPECPIECPAQFPGTVPDRSQQIDPNGFYPTALELLQPVPEDERDPSFGDDEVRYSALYVGGSGSDQIFEIQFERDIEGQETGRWAAPSTTQSLLLADAKGVHKIRVTPTTLRTGAPGLRGRAFPEVHQFLYVVAGDGSTRVVDRDFDETRLGVECDTQRDPTLVSADDACVPIDSTALGGPSLGSPDRRPFAVGPGIRAQNGAAITDWTFQRVDQAQADAFASAPGDGSAAARAPFTAPGVVGIGVTSTGRVVFATFEQFVGAEALTESIDPAGVMAVSISPHSLWPSDDPTVLSPSVEALPRLDDAEPDRALPGPEDTAQELSPALRRIDLAYAAAPSEAEILSEGDVDVGFEQAFIASGLGSPRNADQLGSFSGETGLYEQRVARVAVRDYEVWTSQSWSFTWEGSIPGTLSPTGRIECATPGWEGGTCAVRGGAPDQIQLVDESAAFCDNGVLPGDKLVLLGCGDDTDCGLGQRCLTEPTAPSNTGGLCVSAQAYEDDLELLRAACAPFIDDPCRQPTREYLISEAFQDRLYLQMLDRPRTAHFRETGNPDAPLVEFEDRYTCRLPVADGGNGEPIACSEDEQCPTDFICANDGVCRGPCVGGEPGCRECQADEECEGYGAGAICSDGLCQRPCVPGDPDCILMPLPGPRCYAELVDYVVRARDAFVVEGSAVGFFTDRVYPDESPNPDGTLPPSGRCREDDSVSTLLDSRIRLGRDTDATRNDPYHPILDCLNPDEAAPTDPNPCWITQSRETDDSSLFHYFSYQQQPVGAIRYSNPFGSFVLDLVSLRDLASELTFLEEPGQRWPTSFAEFRRSRIPRNYREEVITIDGHVPFELPVDIGNVPMVYPVRIIDGPELGAAFIVDAGGRGGVAGVRGQIIRIDAARVSGGEADIGDQNFQVR